MLLGVTDTPSVILTLHELGDSGVTTFQLKRSGRGACVWAFLSEFESEGCPWRQKWGHRVAMRQWPVSSVAHRLARLCSIR